MRTVGAVTASGAVGDGRVSAILPSSSGGYLLFGPASPKEGQDGYFTIEIGPQGQILSSTRIDIAAALTTPAPAIPCRRGASQTANRRDQVLGAVIVAAAESDSIVLIASQPSEGSADALERLVAQPLVATTRLCAATKASSNLSIEASLCTMGVVLTVEGQLCGTESRDL